MSVAHAELSRPLVIAHRGVHDTGAVENTLAAFELAADLGADMIELDVRRTGRGELAVLHDDNVDGVTLASGSLDELERRTGFRPPLLAEVLSWARGRIGLDVELKEDGYVDQVVALLADFAAPGSELIVTSFLEPVVAQLTAAMPLTQCGLLLAGSALRATDRARACGATIVLPEAQLVDEGLIAETSKAGLPLIVWDFLAAEHVALIEVPILRGVITDDLPGSLAARAAAAQLGQRHR
ncbi:MAG: glycerophosphodiester phosphodiesterase [Solirubrobacteraceae bacterium]|jgi:glycerophosphoryl diester phosphodiesterase